MDGGLRRDLRSSLKAVEREVLLGTLAESLDSLNGMAFCLISQADARIYRFAIHQYRTSPTFSGFAAMLDAKKTSAAQHLEQAIAR